MFEKEAVERVKIIAYVMWGAQFLIAGLVAFLPIGFDKPSSLGLDYSFFLLMAFLFLFVYIFNLAFYAVSKNWIGLLVQFFAGPMIFYIGVGIQG